MHLFDNIHKWDYSPRKSQGQLESEFLKFTKVWNPELCGKKKKKTIRATVLQLMEGKAWATVLQLMEGKAWDMSCDEKSISDKTYQWYMYYVSPGFDMMM